MKIYGIGGLGVDQRVFSTLRLDFELEVLPWLKPMNKESLSDYVKRFAKQIDITNPLIIIGVSFGGIMAIELSKILPVFKILLISSATSAADIPFSFKVISKLGLLNVLPAKLIKPPTFMANWLFGISDKHHQLILSEIIKDTDPDFLRWALLKIAAWDNCDITSNLVRIHGTADSMLGYDKKDKSIIEIPHGGHFMVMDKADKLSAILNQELAATSLPHKG